MSDLTAEQYFEEYDKKFKEETMNYVTMVTMAIKQGYNVKHGTPLSISVDNKSVVISLVSETEFTETVRISLWEDKKHCLKSSTRIVYK